MGGSIGFTIREENGKEHRMCRWTNVTPGFFNNIRFINKDPEYLNNFLKTWQDFVEDYKLHKKDKKFVHNMTDIYAPYPFLAPIEYGLIVVDYKTNTVIHSQNYSSIDKFLAIGLYDDEEKLETCKELMDEKRITGYEAWDRLKKEDIINKKKNINLSEAIELSKNSDIAYLTLYVDSKPWTFHRYKNDNVNGWNQFKKHILDLGFKLTKKEEKIWAMHLTYFSE